MANQSERVSEPTSDRWREMIGAVEPRSQRTFTPSLAVIAKSAGVFHWTPEGHRLYDFTSGVLVANLGHNNPEWQRRFQTRLSGLPLTAYNAITPIEAEASEKLVQLLRSSNGGRQLSKVLWASTGSEAIQKALWACLARDSNRDIVLATRHGFHGKKGLANAVTGCETDPDRDPRVRFISFPMCECIDCSFRARSFQSTAYREELDQLWSELGPRIGTLITEPYLGAAGSFHPPPEYLQMLQRFCSEHDIAFILDEVQSNFGRTGRMFAFESYQLSPDVVVLGKSLANGVPVAAVVGRPEILDRLDYGQASDTWSANPLSCAAVLATLECFEDPAILANARESSGVVEAGLVRLKELPFVGHVRGEAGGMVWGVELCDHAGRTSAAWANDVVLSCYHGEGQNGIHLLGPLAKNVIRNAPPLIITRQEAEEAMQLMFRCCQRMIA